MGLIGKLKSFKRHLDVLLSYQYEFSSPSTLKVSNLNLKYPKPIIGGEKKKIKIKPTSFYDPYKLHFQVKLQHGLCSYSRFQFIFLYSGKIPTEAGSSSEHRGLWAQALQAASSVFNSSEVWGFFSGERHKIKAFT